MKVHNDLPIPGRLTTQIYSPLYKGIEALQVNSCLEVEIDDLNYAKGNEPSKGRPTRADLTKKIATAVQYYNRKYKDKRHFLYRTMSENSVGIWRGF